MFQLCERFSLWVFHIFFYLSPRIVAVEGSLGTLPEGWKLADFSSPIRWGWVEWNDRERSSFVTPLSIVYLCLYFYGVYIYISVLLYNVVLKPI